MQFFHKRPSMKSHRKKKAIKIVYEYVPDEYSEARLEDIYFMLFDEIQNLIVNENEQSGRRNSNKSYI